MYSARDAATMWGTMKTVISGGGLRGPMQCCAAHQATEQCSNRLDSAAARPGGAPVLSVDIRAGNVQDEVRHIDLVGQRVPQLVKPTGCKLKIRGSTTVGMKRKWEPKKLTSGRSQNWHSVPSEKLFAAEI